MKKAFVLMPFRPPFNSYYSKIYKPALESAGYDVTRADELFGSRPIIVDIHKLIKESDLILCDMSTRNPNVFYELGLAHALGKPVILISNNIDDIPFDLKHIRTIIYKTDEVEWEKELSESITKYGKEENIRIYFELLTPSIGSGKLSEIFFKHTDDINEITQAVRTSQKSYFWGTALIMHIPMLQEEIANAIDKGSQIRFLLVKPGSGALRLAAFRAKEIEYEKLNIDLLNNLDTLNALAARKSTKGKLEVKVIDYFAPYTLYLFDVGLPSGWVQARLSSLRVAHTNRPTYRLTKKDDEIWYEYHVEQFEKAWELAESHQPNGT
ncbi:MAG: hypothetical protein HOP27_16780 [Anaerolineales bacterium]|nr:hypothetical protein [Anaerolineales bacterium]